MSECVYVAILATVSMLFELVIIYRLVSIICNGKVFHSRKRLKSEDGKD